MACGCGKKHLTKREEQRISKIAWSISILSISLYASWTFNLWPFDFEKQDSMVSAYLNCYKELNDKACDMLLNRR